ncbi:hypothetical protein [Tunturibacter empetritectus]|uniref:Uncharacterized protein n=1 Tax=Tunturiibacter empetritectus TaxID=3069691 RepID=A0A7W8ILE2_9BACT|nr:hypothetical protein [Edaphobacter lichenicola]MBB5319262.1 hypothetical protein [Edaphobacter lichenicola]
MTAIARSIGTEILAKFSWTTTHPIRTLHRHDGYITFMVKDAGDPDRRERHFAIRVDALDTWFPEFTDRSSVLYGLHSTTRRRLMTAKALRWLAQGFV